MKPYYLLILILLISCGEDQLYTFSGVDLALFPYQQGDSLLLYNDDYDTICLKVEYRSRYRFGNSDEYICSYCHYEDWECIKIGLVSVDTTRLNNIAIMADKKNGYNKLSLYMRMKMNNVNYIMDAYFSDGLIYGGEDKYYETISINGKTYSDVFLIKEVDTGNSGVSDHFTQVYLAFDYGIVQVLKFEGDHMFIWNAIL